MSEPFFLSPICSLFSINLDDSLDVDPNYDPSDFLHLPKSRPKYDDKGEFSKNVKTEHDITDSQGSFNMSEMLRERSNIISQESGYNSIPSLPSLPSFPGSQDIDMGHVGIQDDLAISDSDEDEQDRKSELNDTPNRQADSSNVKDDALWF